MAGVWRLNPGEELDVGKSLGADLDSGELLDGSPTIEIFRKNASGGWDDETSDFGIASAQVNTAEFTDQDGNVVPVGEGVVFRLTAPATEGEWVAEISCPADDGSTPMTSVAIVVSREP